MLIYHWQGKIATLHSSQKNHLTPIIHLRTLREESDELKDCTENRRSAPLTQKRITIKLTVTKQQQTAKKTPHQTQEHWYDCYVQADNFYFGLNKTIPQIEAIVATWHEKTPLLNFWQPWTNSWALQVFCNCALWGHECLLLAGKADIEMCDLEQNKEGSHNNESQYFCCCANFLPPSHFSSSSAGGPTAPSTSHLLVRKLLLLFCEFGETSVMWVNFTQMASVNV